MGTTFTAGTVIKSAEINANFAEVKPMTTGGDIIYGGASGVPTRLANGTAGQVLQSNGTTVAPSWFTPFQLIHVRDEKTANTAGGSSSATSDHTRTLNTVVTNTLSGSSLATNQVTLPAGTYLVRGSSPAFVVDQHRARLVNDTDATVAILGTSEYSTTTQSHSAINGIITIASSKAFSIVHYCLTAKATNGLGVAVNDTRTEIYTDIMFIKIA